MEHALGSFHAPVLFEEYGDYQSPESIRAHPIILKILSLFGPDLRFVFRNFPLRERHPYAERAAEAAQAAAEQGKFWEMHEFLFASTEHLLLPALIDCADQLGLDVERFEEELTNHAHCRSVSDELSEARRRGVREPPALFINGVRYEGPLGVDPLREAIQRPLDQELIRRAC